MQILAYFGPFADGPVLVSGRKKQPLVDEKVYKTQMFFDPQSVHHAGVSAFGRVELNLVPKLLS